MMDLREHFGLSQAQLAKWIMINIGQIKMFEACKRKFPTQLSRNGLYRELSNLEEAGPVPVEQAPPEALAKEEAAVKRELKSCLLGAQLLAYEQDKKLKKMQKNYQQALNLHKPAKRRKHIADLAKIQEDWLDDIVSKTDNTLHTSGLKAQAMLQMKIDVNRFALQKAQELAQQLGMQE